jgi:hypothetical protein
MSKVQNVLNYGVADVPDELIADLGPRWVPGDSLSKPPFVPPWGEEGKEPGATPGVVLTGVDIKYGTLSTVNFTAIKGVVNDPDGDEAFLFSCVEVPSLNGYVGREFQRVFPGTTVYNCSLEDIYGDGSGDPATRKTVTFTVKPQAADAVPTKKATTAKG